MKLYILIILFFTQFAVGAQNIIIGKIINEKTKMPIQNVNIQILPNHKFGYITDEKGRFRIVSHGNVITLKLSHVSYNTEIVTLNKNSVPDSGLTIVMTPKIYILNEVNIYEKQYQTIYKKFNQSVLDYAIYKRRIFFIVKDFYNGTIKMYSDNINLSDPFYLIPPVTPKSLIIDFYGNLDFVSKKDSVYQIVVIDTTVYFLKPFPLQKLSRLKQLYKFKINNKYYFSEFVSIVKDKINFGYVTDNEKVKIFFSVYDENKIDYYYDEMCFLGIILHQNHVPPGEKRREKVSKYYNSPALYVDKLFFYNNISNVFFHIQNNVFIIDNVHNNLLRFDEDGTLISKNTIKSTNNHRSISSHLLKKEEGRIWKESIIIDPYDTTKVYFVWKDGVKSKLFDLNLFTGSIRYIKTLPHIYPKKLRIYNKKLYFLYEKIGYLHSYGLYRTNLY